MDSAHNLSFLTLYVKRNLTKCPINRAKENTLVIEFQTVGGLFIENGFPSRLGDKIMRTEEEITGGFRWRESQYTYLSHPKMTRHQILRKKLISSMNKAVHAAKL